MSNDPNKRQVRIHNVKTGEVRLSEPVPTQTARSVTSNTAVPPTEQAPTATATDGPVSAPAPGAEPRAVAQPGDGSAAEPADEAPPPIDAAAKAAGAGESSPSKGTAKSEHKTEIETLEQFIGYAYGRKGRSVTLKPKVERLIAQQPRLDDEAMSRLQAAVEGDALLAVPRQLLLVGAEVQGLPALRAALNGFVSAVMQRNPVFADAGVLAAMRNLPEAPTAAYALATVAAYAPAAVEGKDAFKSADLQVLRRNAAHLLATWFAINRSMNAEQLASLLFQVLWAPAARDLVDDNARLRALTEVEQPAGVGVACQRFRQLGIEARTAQDQAQREAAGLRTQVAELEARLAAAEDERNTALAELDALRQESAAELTTMRKQHEVERVHLRHDQEQLRGRLVRKLSDSVEMLEVGLKALQNKTPRTEVMLERAEHVIDALRAEANELKAE